MGRYEEAVSYFKKSIAVCNKLSPDGDNIEKAHTLVSLGLSYNNMAEYNQAHDCFVKALTIYEKLSCNSDHIDYTQVTMSYLKQNQQRQLIHE